MLVAGFCLKKKSRNKPKIKFWDNKKIKKQQACKPGPVVTENSATAYHLSRPGLTARLNQPAHPDRFPKKPGSEQLHFRDLFGLSTPEVYPATLVAQSTGALLPHLFTLTLF